MRSIAQERWRMVKGSERYAVSDQGRVVSLGNMAEMQPRINPKGYARVHLPNGRRLVHRLVADAFLQKPKPGETQINHKNGDKVDNRVVNLEWITPGGNLLHAYRELGRKAATEGKHLSAETRAKISASNRGRIISEEWRRRISEGHKGIQALGNNPRARKTMCLETGEIFPCSVEAAMHFGLTRGCVHHGIKSGNMVAGRWHFSYVKENDSDKNQ